MPPGDGTPTFPPGKAVAGREANLAPDVLEASRAERVANGWGEAEIIYLSAVVGEDPLRGARHVAELGGALVETTDADHVVAIESVSKKLNDAPVC